MMSSIVQVQQHKAVFLKPVVIDNFSLEKGKCSKDNDNLDEEMNMTVDEKPDKEIETGANKGRKDKELTFSVTFVRVKSMWQLNVQQREPRPMDYVVGYAVDEMGFYHIPHGPINMKDGLIALIKVKGWLLKEGEPIVHLKQLVLVNFDWEVHLDALDTWIAHFQSKVDLKHTINFGRSLNFEIYEEEEYFGEGLPFIWMRVVNLPRELQTYEVLWVLGTMFRPTQ